MPADCPPHQVRFFALFFWQELGMSPVATNAVYACGPVGIAALAFVMQRVSRTAGRPLTTIVCRTSSVLCLAMIAALTHWMEGRGGSGAAGSAFMVAQWSIPPLYIIRTWLMNCTSGLTKSILNDYVSRRNRAKWNALESVNLFSWRCEDTLMTTDCYRLPLSAALLPLLLSHE